MLKLKQITKLLRPRKVIEQHIAVFGETGSGKTTLLSTFYGWHQEPRFEKTKGYSLFATNTTQSNRLLSNFLKIKDNQFPTANRFKQQSYQFNVKIRGLEGTAATIIWHDYPGEWWTQTKEGEEQNRKIEAFRTLLQSDIAFVLCDGQRLKNEGSPYLNLFFAQFYNEIQSVKEKIMEGQRLTLFPRVWVICLSKADLFPDQDIYWFRDQVVKTAQDKLAQLEELIKTMIVDDSYVSIGSDFLLLSSVELDDRGNIVNPDHYIGIDLIPPISLIIPIEKRLFWLKIKSKVKDKLYLLAELMRRLTTNWLKYLPIIGNVFMLVDDEMKTISQKLEEIEEKAKKRGDLATAILAAFQRRLKDESADQIYISQAIYSEAQSDELN
jgi:GTPase SAR1 family protein